MEDSCYTCWNTTADYTLEIHILSETQKELANVNKAVSTFSALSKVSIYFYAVVYVARWKCEINLLRLSDSQSFLLDCRKQAKHTRAVLYNRSMAS